MQRNLCAFGVKQLKMDTLLALTINYNRRITNKSNY